MQQNAMHMRYEWDRETLCDRTANKDPPPPRLSWDGVEWDRLGGGGTKRVSGGQTSKGRRSACICLSCRLVGSVKQMLEAGEGVWAGRVVQCGVE